METRSEEITEGEVQKEQERDTILEIKNRRRFLFLLIR